MAISFFPLHLFAATEIHVSPAGNDTNPGTHTQPVATPQRAQELVRAIIAAGLTEPVDIIFADGIYQIDTPLELRPEDSGTTNFPITWKAADGATPILSGGKTITGTWTDGGDGIWHIDLTGSAPGAGQWNFRLLFVSGSRATRARFPNASEANPFLYATGGGFDHAIIDPTLIKPEWGTAADVQINIVPRSRFFNQWNTVTAVNAETGRIDIADSERHREIDAGSWFWIEGVREELDEPGEWFLDVENGRLHTMPEPGVDPNTLEFIAPFLNRIINAQGDVNAGTHVAHVHIDGLHFRHTTFTLGHIEARVHTDTAIMFENTLDSIVRNCHFENIGGYALWLHLDSRRNHFDRNTVRQSGGGGVLLTGSRLSYMDDTKVYTPGEAAARVAPILNSITRNTTVKNNWIHNSVGGAIKPIWQNWNLVIEDNRESDTPITPPFADQVGPDGTATHGIDLESTRLTGSVIHHSDARHVATTGAWKKQTATGMWGLFEFNFLTATAATPSEATYTLPITEDGTYQICLLYPSGRNRASNVPVTIHHAEGTAELEWNMKAGSRHGFAVELGKFPFKAGEKATVTLSTTGTNGLVIADSVAFVKMAE